MLFGLNLKNMKENMVGRFEFSNELKDRLTQMVMYKGADPKLLVKKYALSHVIILLNWVLSLLTYGTCMLK